MTIRLALILALAATGCQKTPEQPIEPPAPATPPAPDAPKPPTEVPTPPPDAPKGPVAPSPNMVDEAAARGLVERWLEAQNTGAYDAYAATYADRFFGVKRSGERTYRFDRAGWLKDRRRMFKKPMTVGITDVKILPGPGTARVIFTQTWASGDYRDVGPKQLVLAMKGGALQIAREEMLRSTLLDPTPRDESPTSLNLAMVLDAPYVVLGPAPEIEGRPTVVARGRPHVVRVAAPDKADRRHGARVALYGPNGRSCVGTIDRLAVLGRAIPHFGAIQTWAGEMDDSGEKATPEQIARDIWEMSDGGGRLLVGVLDVDKAECAGAIWARFEAPNARPAAAWKARKPVATERLAVVEAVRKTDAWKAIQKDFEAHEDGKGPWDASSYTNTGTRVYARPGAEPLAVVTMDAGLSCGGFGGGVWQVFALGSHGPRPLAPPSMTPFTPMAAMEGLQGQPILIGVEGYSGEETVFEEKAGAWHRRQTLTVPDLDCPC